MTTQKFRSLCVDSLLLAAIASLVAALFRPAFEAWQNRPRPGMQVCQQNDGQEGRGHNAVEAYVDYLLYLPQEYDASRKWPLVIFLHGAGERGQDLGLVRRLGPPRQIDQGEQFPFILLSPQCRADSSWNPERLVKLIERISDCFAVDPDRVYLTGYSMGGSGVWNAACYDPGRFAAIVPLAGRGDAAQAKRLVNLPIWAFHGAIDKAVPLEESKAMVDAVRKCGGHVDFTVYPDCGHGICDRPFQEGRIYKWLLAQRRNQHSSLGIQEKDIRQK